MQDELTGKEWDVQAKCIINATGPFTDSLRKMDDPSCKEICCPSSGVHIVLPGYYRYFGRSAAARPSRTLTRPLPQP